MAFWSDKGLKSILTGAGVSSDTCTLVGEQFGTANLQAYLSIRMNQRNGLSYPVQFALLLALVGSSMIIGSLLVALLAAQLMGVSLLQVPDALNLPEHANVSRLFNTLGTLVSFLLPVLIFVRIQQKKAWSYLGLNQSANIRQVFLVVLISLAGMVLSGALGELNQHIVLPGSWQQKAQAMEQAYKSAMMNMAYMPGWTDFILALLVMALAPAIFEEVLFRGAFQQLFVAWTRRPWLGILIASILFSAIHFSFFGFLPRAALGLLLGFIFQYTGKLWLSILMHFLNNAIVVTQLFVLGKQGQSIEKVMDDNTPVWWGLLAVPVLWYLFRLLQQETNRTFRNHTETI